MLKIICIIYIGCIALLTGCATIPPDAQNEASKELQGACFAMFSYPRYSGDQRAGMYAGRVGYQYWGESLRYKAFAIGYKADNQQVCAYYMAGKLAENSSQEYVTSVAINSCNNVGVDNCVVYATGDNNIIYNKIAHFNKINDSRNIREIKLSEEGEKNKRRQAEAEERKRVEIQQLAHQEKAPSTRYHENLSDTPSQIKNEIKEIFTLETAKKKCAELGFKPSTEAFGKCALQLSK
jgi:hypothetical protein